MSGTARDFIEQGAVAKAVASREGYAAAESLNLRPMLQRRENVLIYEALGRVPADETWPDNDSLEPTLIGALLQGGVPEGESIDWAVRTLDRASGDVNAKRDGIVDLVRLHLRERLHAGIERLNAGTRFGEADLHRLVDEMLPVQQRIDDLGVSKSWPDVCRAEIDKRIAEGNSRIISLGLGKLKAMRSNLIYVTAPPAHGKSLWVQLHPVWDALQNGLSVLIIQQEMGIIEYVERFLIRMTGHDPDLFWEAMNPDEEPSAEAVAKLSDFVAAVDEITKWERLSISERIGTVHDIASAARRHKALWGSLDLLVVDYVQQVAPPDGMNDALQSIELTSRSLKQLSMELDCLTIGVVQPDKASGREMTAGSLRGAQALEADANMILGVNNRGDGTKRADRKIVGSVAVLKSRRPVRGWSPTWLFDPDRGIFTEQMEDWDSE